MNKNNKSIHPKIFVATALLSIALTVCLLAYAQNVTVDGVSLDSEQQGELIQAQQQKAGDFASIRAEAARVIRFLEVRAAPVISGPAEQTKVDNAIVVVRAIARRLMEAKAAEVVTGQTVKRGSLQKRLTAADRVLSRATAGGDTDAILSATEARDTAQANLGDFTAANPE